MIDYLMRHPERVLVPFAEHIRLVALAMLISVFCAALLTVLSVLYRPAGKVLLHLFSVIYSIPSLALFALLIPVTGLGRVSALIVLVLYNQFLLLRNFLEGIRNVDPGVTEAAAGIGFSPLQMLFRVQLPLAAEAVLTGVRIALISTTGIAVIAASINAGGLGTLLFEGLRTMNIPKIGWGSLLAAGLALTSDALLRMAGAHGFRRIQRAYH